MKISSYINHFVLAGAIGFMSVNTAYAESLCLKAVVDASGKVQIKTHTVKQARCPRDFTKILNLEKLVDKGEQGEIGPQGPPGPQGAVGATGSAGVDATDSVYGNGSAGSVVISSSIDWSGASPSNFQFENFTVNPGVVLGVTSGTIIRTTGSFTNNGTIRVFTGADGGNIGCDFSVGPCDPPNTFASYRSPQIGVGKSAPSCGDMGSGSIDLGPGTLGTGLGILEARHLGYPGARAGAGGMCPSTGSSPMAGGGSIVVLSKSTITNESSGIIRANPGNTGIPGCSGGSGGIVILAAKISINQLGIIETKGGNGLNGDSNFASGAGGSGGIIHLLSPTINSSGSLITTGGTGGASAGAGTLTSTFKIGGCSGAAIFGAGGQGSFINMDGSYTAATNGTTSVPILTQADPTSLF